MPQGPSDAEAVFQLIKRKKTESIFGWIGWHLQGEVFMKAMFMLGWLLSTASQKTELKKLLSMVEDEL